MTSSSNPFDNPFARAYQGRTMPAQPALTDVRSALSDYRAMLLSIMHVVTERSERSYGGRLIDTKFSTLSGLSYPEDDLIRGPGLLYGYIQGRGLEALAEHCTWIAEGEDEAEATALKSRLEAMMASVLATLREFRSLNGGHLYFFMTPEGRPMRLGDSGSLEPVRLNADSPFTKTDLFCSKGMYLAAQYLGDEAAAAEALQYCHDVYDALWSGNLGSDQQPLDPKNVSRDLPGRVSHSPYMLLLDMADILLRFEPSPENLRFGLRLIERVVDHHTYGSPAAGEFEPHDFWEFVDDGGRPYRAGAAVPSDPGHALEFVGFAMRFLDSAKRKVENAAAVVPPGLVENLPRVMERNFANGFNAEAGGIVKSFDLVARRPLNSDMPWWNLPETMRAAAFCWRSSRDPEVQDASLRILAACHNAFTERFVRREIGLSAVQTRSASGEDVDVIPATSDADPGYHTGISMIDTLRVFDAAAG